MARAAAAVAQETANSDLQSTDSEVEHNESSSGRVNVSKLDEAVQALLIEFCIVFVEAASRSWFPRSMEYKQ